MELHSTPVEAVIKGKLIAWHMSFIHKAYIAVSLITGAKYSGIFYLWVQNIPEYFTCGCKIFWNILPAGAKYSGKEIVRACHTEGSHHVGTDETIASVSA